MPSPVLPPAHGGQREPGLTAAAVPPARRMLDLDKPLYTISVAAEILASHPRTLMMYETMGLGVPDRTATNRRRYSQRDILTLSAIQRFTRQSGLNIAGARYVIKCLQLLDKHGIARPPELGGVDIENVLL
jgi:MerR family transcriptional regulator, heat shock protein HspR